MAELEMTDTTPSTEAREQSWLNLICLIVAALFLALAAYNLFAAGAVISTDGLFFTVVPLVLALSFLAVPGMDMLKKRRAAKAAAIATEGFEAAGAVAIHAEPIEEVHFAGSNKLFMSVWLWLLLLTGFEVFLGYIRLPAVY